MTRFGDQADGLRVIRRAPESLAPRLRPRSRMRRTIAVTSGKGGVGKTQMAANLAIGLGQQGLKVLLLDADLGLASLDLALGVTPEDDLLSVLRGQRRIEDVLVPCAAGVQLLPACPGRYEMANLSANEHAILASAIDDVAEQFDVLLIDTGAGIGSNAVSFAAAADDVVLVTTPDPTSLRDAYAMAKVLNKRTGVTRINVLANQVASEAEGAQIHERLAGIVRRFLTLDLTYLGCVLRDDQVRQSTALGQPFVLRAPASSAARALQIITRKLMPSNDPRAVC